MARVIYENFDRGIVISNVANIYEKLSEQEKAELFSIHSDELISGVGLLNLSRKEREEFSK